MLHSEKKGQHRHRKVVVENALSLTKKSRYSMEEQVLLVCTTGTMVLLKAKNKGQKWPEQQY